MRKRLTSLLHFIVAFLICLTRMSSTTGQSTAEPSAPPDLDAYVASSMKSFEVPEMAVAIVRDGKIVLKPLADFSFDLSGCVVKA